MEIDIQHPRNRDERMHPMLIRNAGVATSGDYMQFIKRYEESHVVGGSLASVTVVDSSLMHADATATCLMISPKSRAFLKSKALLISRDMHEEMINSFESLLVKA
jgi:thiamine biosynthesis lipoprotein ApbE